MSDSDLRPLHTDMIGRDLYGAVNRRPDPQSPQIELKVIQSPENCRVAGKQDKEKTRPSKYPLDPAPVIEFNLHDGDASRSFMHSPFWFCTAALESCDPHLRTTDEQPNMLSGCVVSSLHKVKMAEGQEKGLFIFPDLNAKIQGNFRLRFTLYELRHSTTLSYVATLKYVHTKQFVIHSGKTWPGQSESTPLSRLLCESGVKLRIRKETSKRKAQSQDWSADKRTALSPYNLPGPGLMVPPAIDSYRNLRRTNGDDIQGMLLSTREGLSSSRDSLGIRHHMDQQAQSYAGGQQQQPRPQPISLMGPPSGLYNHQPTSSQSRPLVQQHRANPGYMYQQTYSAESMSAVPGYGSGYSNSPTLLRQPSSPQHHRTSSTLEYSGMTSQIQERPVFLPRSNQCMDGLPPQINRYVTTVGPSPISYADGMAQTDPSHGFNMARNDNLGHDIRNESNYSRDSDFSMPQIQTQRAATTSTDYDPYRTGRLTNVSLH